MACCSMGGGCPMHVSTEAGSDAAVTQTQADSCCAASESDDSTPSTGVFAISMSAALFPTAFSPSALVITPLVWLNASRSDGQLPVGHVATHVLLSVFLI
jgi:hypothetical protein